MPATEDISRFCFSQDPIYTVDNGSFFVLNVETDKFIEDPKALTFIVKDKDAMGMKNDELGHVYVSGSELCNANGERMTYVLTPKEGSKHKEAGVIHIRCRPATNYDKKFLEFVNSDQKGDFLGIGSNMSIVMNPRGGAKELIKSKLKVEGEFCPVLSGQALLLSNSHYNDDFLNRRWCH